MKDRFLDLAVVFIAFGFIFWGFKASQIHPPTHSFVLAAPHGSWKFETTLGSYSTAPGSHVCSLLPATEPCQGRYLGLFKRSQMISVLKNSQLSLYLPAIPGAQGVWVNGVLVQGTQRSFSSLAGFTVPVDSALAFSKPELQIEIPIQSNQKTLIGMIIEAPILGDFAELNTYRDHRVSYIQNLPLAFTFVYAVIAVVFSWLIFRAKIRDRIYQEFVIYFFSFSLFHFFLSGVLRDWFPFWGSVLQFPFSILASCGCFRLIGSFAEMPCSTVNRLSWVYVFSAGVSCILTLLGFEQPQFIFYFLSRVWILYPLFKLSTHLKSPLHRIIFINAFFFVILYISDAIKILSRTVIAFPYPFGFTARHVSPLIFFVSVVYLIYQMIQENRELTRKQAWEDLARQVAHDIRSPLAALNFINFHTSHLPEEYRVILRSASNRIQDIANLLLEYPSRQFHTFSRSEEPLTGPDEPLSCSLLANLTESIVAEKRFQYRSEMKIEIDVRLSSSAYGLFANIQPNELKRVLSNLIDNSAEAFQSKNGNIEVLLTSKDQNVHLKIKDNGGGIPSEIIDSLGKKGFSHQKKSGRGLGLYHAKSRLETWGGKFQIESTVNQGTEVTLIFPRASAPKWFVPRILVDDVMNVFIADDDPSIHYTWQRRFEGFQIDHEDIRLFHFSTLDSLEDYLKKHPPETSTPVLYLIDNEFTMHSKTGIDFISSYQVQTKSILVTSHGDESRIADQCSKNGISMIPKFLVGAVPIQKRIHES